MSAGGAFGGARGYQPRAPEKGVFPLDHFGECKQIKEQYMSCLKAHSSESEPCRHLAKQYLQCRMERNLMAKQDLADLGFRKGEADGPMEQPAAPPQQQQQQQTPAVPPSQQRQHERAGFVAGTKRFD